MRRLAPTAALLLVCACELQEVTVAQPEDIVIAEIVLRVGEPRQLALLHRTFGPGTVADPVPDASILVRDDEGTPFAFMAAADSICIRTGDEDEEDPPSASCYMAVAEPGASLVEPGSTYTLQIELPGGGTLSGMTRTPDAFRISTPDSGTCRVLPDTTLPIAWTSSAGTWAYIVETLLHGVTPALAERGIQLEEDPLRLVGLAVARDDTTIVFPREFGLFDRFDSDLTEALVELQAGLPQGVDADVIIGAADRNYVNWARGGNFNPSGITRVPSIVGDGTGVFGAITPRALRVTTDPDSPAPPCDPD